MRLSSVSIASSPKSSRSLSRASEYASSTNSTPSSARRITRSVLTAVSPTYWPTSPARSTSTRWPRRSSPMERYICASRRATVVLPVPGLPRKTRCCVVATSGSPASLRRACTRRKATSARTCSLTDSSPGSASSSSSSSSSGRAGSCRRSASMSSSSPICVRSWSPSAFSDSSGFGTAWTVPVGPVLALSQDTARGDEGSAAPARAIVNEVNGSGGERPDDDGEPAASCAPPARARAAARDPLARRHRRPGQPARPDQEAAGDHGLRARRPGTHLRAGHVGPHRAARGGRPDRADARRRPPAHRTHRHRRRRQGSDDRPEAAHRLAHEAPAGARRRLARRAAGRAAGAREADGGAGAVTLLRVASARTFASLRNHYNYRLFFAGQLTSVAGTWMQNIALAWLVVDLAPHWKGLALGLLTMCRFGPYTLLGLFAGVVTDRFDNRRTVIVTQSVQMVFSALLAALTLFGAASLWEVYAIAVLTGIAVVFDAPSRQNLTFQMVGRDELPNAIALNSSLFNTARIFGPALAGVLIAAFGVGWCFAINAASFLAVLAGLLAMRLQELYPLADRRRPTLLKGTREGLAYARRNRSILVLITMVAVFSSFCFNFNILLPLLAKSTLHAGPRTFGVISACFGAGALVGALSAAAIAKARWRTMFAGAAGFGLCELLLAPVHAVALAGALLFVCGVFFTSYTANSNAAIQLASPDHLRGRVLGLYYYAWNGLAPLGALVVGWLCDVGGTELAFAVGGACAVAMTVLGAAAIKRPFAHARAARPTEPAGEQLAA